MSEKEYIVSLNAGINYDAFWDQIENESDTDGFVPTRRVDIINERPGSLRSCHYSLTDEEAAALRADSRVYSVEIPPEQRDDIEIGHHAVQSGTWTKDSTMRSADLNWGMIRGAFGDDQWGNGTTSIVKDFPYTLTGKGVDVVIQDSGLSVDHPEFLMEDTAEYTSTAVASDSSNGAVFDRSLTVHGIKIVVAGAVGGQLTVPAFWAEKTAKVIQLLISPTGTHINLTDQKKLIATLKGDAGTTHAGMPTAQRIGYGGGDSYTPNWLSDAGAAQYSGYTDFLDSHVHNDMVWYKNTSGPDPSTSDRDIEEIMEHLFHTIHNFGIPGAVGDSATQVPMDMLLFIMQENPSFSWTTTALHLAMKEAINAGLYDPSGYATDWATDYEAAVVAYKEYTYLVNWSMWDMSQFWLGGSLSPEWDDSLKTRAGMKANNPLGYALFIKYFQPVLSKPSFTTLQAIFQDNDAGDSQYQISNSGYYRVQQIDWYEESSIIGTQNANHYRDYHGHGSHCAGTVAGRTMGWAKDAAIYSVKVSGLEGTGDATGISVTNCFDVIKLWHRNKPVDPVTGFKRPTVVNMSWGYGGSRSSIVSGTFRGSAWTYSDPSFSTSNEVWANAGIIPVLGSTRRVNVRVGSVDTDLEELIAEGVHVCIAAGNSYYYVAIDGDQDWDNSVNLGLGAEFYHRGSSPYSTNAFMVGNQDITYLGGVEHKAESSCTGPGVDIYAPGTSITSVASTDKAGACDLTDGTDGSAATANSPLNASYKLMKISGTSMASPNVAGMIATILEANPGMTPAQVKTFIHNNATQDVLYDTGVPNANWNDQDSVHGGPNRIFKTPFVNPDPLRINNISSSASFK
jgi:subtilisin family serine protease